MMRTAMVVKTLVVVVLPPEFITKGAYRTAEGFPSRILGA